MTIEQAVKTKLLADTGLTALIGTRLYPDTIQQGATFPALTYSQASGDNAANVSGELNGLAIDTFDLVIEGPERAAVGAIRDYLITNYSGATARGTWGDKAVRGCVVQQVQSTDIPPADASERHDRQCRLSLVIHWKR